MYLDQAIVINDREAEDGRYLIHGWINCPPDSRVILRFVTKGSAADQVVGLHWAVTGGWYKYLPATGKRERFEVEAYFDEVIHGIPEIRIERWFGNGDIELLLDRPGWHPVTAFWGSDQAYAAFVNETVGLIERFPYTSCLATAGEPKNGDLFTRLQASNKSKANFPELHADLEKLALSALEKSNFDAIVIDLKSMCVPIWNVQGTYIEVSPEARSLGQVVMEAEILTVADEEYLSVLRRSLNAVLQCIRPRPAIIQIERLPVGQEPEDLDFNEKFESMIEELKLEELGFELLSINGHYSRKPALSERIELEQWIEPYWATFDENMTVPDKPSNITLVSKLTPLADIDVATVSGLANRFRVEVDVLTPLKQYKDRNLLLALELEDSDGNPLDESLSRYSVSRF